MTSDEIQFFHLEEPYGCLSNASRHVIYLDGTPWRSVEHFFQAAKFDGQELRRRVALADTPGQARRLGRKHRRHQRRDWHDVKVGIMKKALRAKAEQHADVRAVLLITRPARVVQSADAGRYWGGGGSSGGKNMLGKLWMEVREDLAHSGEFDGLSRPMLPPWEKYPEIPRGSIGWRMGYGEAYLDEWHAYFAGLSPDGRQHYRERFTPPEEWAGYYEG